jgi:hypothetical protein
MRVFDKRQVTCDVLLQFHEVLRSFNAIQLLLDCIASVRLVNTVVYVARS